MADFLALNLYFFQSKSILFLSLYLCCVARIDFELIIISNWDSQFLIWFVSSARSQSSGDRQLFEIFTRPGTSVTSVTQDHYYSINAIQHYTEYKIMEHTWAESASHYFCYISSLSNKVAGIPTCLWPNSVRFHALGADLPSDASSASQ